MFAIFGGLLLICFMLGFPVVVLLGWGRTKARGLIGEAIIDMRNGSYENARRKVLSAVFYDRRLKNDIRIKKLYDQILSGEYEGQGSGVNTNNILNAFSNEPGSLAESISGNPFARALLGGIVIIYIVIRLLEIASI